MFLSLIFGRELAVSKRRSQLPHSRFQNNVRLVPGD
jgi:hypothetical protein